VDKKKKQDRLPTISPQHKEALAVIGGRPEFKGFLSFLRMLQNNVAVISWFRVKSTDPDIKTKKAYYEGQFDVIKVIMKAFEEAQKGEEEK